MTNVSFIYDFFGVLPLKSVTIGHVALNITKMPIGNKTVAPKMIS